MRARSLFDQAARLAEAQGDAQALGEAALGAGGFWLYEQRSPVAQALVSGWRRSALAGVDPASLIAVRLRVREAAERDYESGGRRRYLLRSPTRADAATGPLWPRRFTWLSIVC